VRTGGTGKVHIMNILIVDDEPVTLAFLRRGVAGPNRTVFEAKSFEDSQKIVAESPIDLVITDLNMPDQNGFAVANMVQQTFPSIPIFLVTGCNDDTNIRFAAMAGFTKIFNKPIHLPRLKEAIDAVERGQRPAPDSVAV